MKQNLTEDELPLRILNELGNLFQSELTSEEKLFAIHRSIVYVLKESATGADYTYPIRLTAVILNNMEKPVLTYTFFISLLLET